jgi:hypothetical protein
MLLAVVGPTTANSTATTYGKPEAAAAVDGLLMMGIRMTENMLSGI